MTRHADPAVRIRHHLKGPVTVIYGRAGLVARDIAAQPGLDDAARAALLAQLETIGQMARRLDAAIDALAREAAEQTCGIRAADFQA